MASHHGLESILSRRLHGIGEKTRSTIDGASQVVIFGSTSTGLETPHSDLDVFCAGAREHRFKSRSLELLCVREDTLASDLWRQGELASHIATYGVWLRGDPEWVDGVRSGPGAVEKKHKRVDAFLRYLGEGWPKLEDCFRIKYAVKLRRETQRLVLLERRTPIPPTAILDSLWVNDPETRLSVWSHLDAAAQASGGVGSVLRHVEHFGGAKVVCSKLVTKHKILGSVAEALRG